MGFAPVPAESAAKPHAFTCFFLGVGAVNWFPLVVVVVAIVVGSGGVLKHLFGCVGRGTGWKLVHLLQLPFFSWEYCGRGR